MTQRPVRVFRNRKLTPEEIARDEQLRRQVQKEFPAVEATALPDEESRKQAPVRLRRSFAAAEKHAQDHQIDDAEIDAAVDEALEQVRYRGEQK